MDQGSELAVVLRAQPDVLFGNRATANHAKSIFARQRQLYRTIDNFRGRHAQRRVAPADFAAETTAKKWRDHADIFCLEVEYIRQRVRGQVDGLRGIENQQASVFVPNGRGGMRFDRIVVVAGRAINMADALFRLRESLLRIADFDFRRLAHDVLGDDRFGFGALEGNLRRLGVILYRHQGCGVLRSLECFRDHHGHRLAVPMYFGILHDGQIA